MIKKVLNLMLKYKKSAQKHRISMQVNIKKEEALSDSIS